MDRGATGSLWKQREEASTASARNENSFKQNRGTTQIVATECQRGSNLQQPGYLEAVQIGYKKKAITEKSLAESGEKKIKLLFLRGRKNSPRGSLGQRQHPPVLPEPEGTIPKRSPSSQLARGGNELQNQRLYQWSSAVGCSWSFFENSAANAEFHVSAGLQEIS